jgi:hypothetical protein
MNNNELLPVGSLVKIRFSKEKYMIMGYYVNDQEKKENYEYVAVTYPLGLLTLNDVAGFDGNMIKQVIHKGYETEESKSFLKELKEEVEELKAKEKNINYQNIEHLGE